MLRDNCINCISADTFVWIYFLDFISKKKRKIRRIVDALMVVLPYVLAVFYLWLAKLRLVEKTTKEEEEAKIDWTVFYSVRFLKRLLLLVYF